MKKTTAILLLTAIIFSCGCNKQEKTETPSATDIGEVQVTDIQITDIQATDVPEEQIEEVTPMPETTSTVMYVSGSRVNVRETPSVDGKKIIELTQNTKVNMLKEENGWSYVEYENEKFGYMKSDYLSQTAVATSAPTASSASSASNASSENTVNREVKKSNSLTDMNDNVFLDALEYTGYNLKKHRSDGKMWTFILGKYKAGLGYLSGMGYNYGRTSGYETTASGFPDIERLKKNGGFVCASYVTYVYFNYLPNVAGIDTSMLTKPTSSVLAQSWRLAAEDWVKKGYSEKIAFTAVWNSDGTVKFTPEKEIPVGSIVVFKMHGASDSADARHVAIYAGYAGGYHWCTHVGNERGPEMITMERMGFSSTAEVPLEIITTPNIIG